MGTVLFLVLFFGLLAAGMPVKKISEVPRGRQDKPNKDVVLKKITIEKV